MDLLLKLINENVAPEDRAKYLNELNDWKKLYKRLFDKLYDMCDEFDTKKCNFSYDDAHGKLTYHEQNTYDAVEDVYNCLDEMIQFLDGQDKVLEEKLDNYQMWVDNDPRWL